jgi:hypothetical protein
MDLKVKMTTQKKAIRAYIEDSVGKYRQLLIRQLFVVGEKCVNDARLQGSYKDRTHNLRSSIGYGVVDNGNIVTVAGFRQLDADAKDGPQKGRDYLDSLLKENRVNGPTLVVVAGMNYAKYVADRGYNVLDSAEMLAERLVKELQLKIGQ